MAKLTFKGGVHPFDGKALSKNKEIKELVPSGEIVIPLSQHIRVIITTFQSSVLCNTPKIPFF